MEWWFISLIWSTSLWYLRNFAISSNINSDSVLPVICCYDWTLWYDNNLPLEVLLDMSFCLLPCHSNTLWPTLRHIIGLNLIIINNNLLLHKNNDFNYLNQYLYLYFLIFFIEWEIQKEKIYKRNSNFILLR